jgi:hypothetical protein
MADAVMGGEMSEVDGGKRGRAMPNTIPLVVPVATADWGPATDVEQEFVIANNAFSIGTAASNLFNTICQKQTLKARQDFVRILVLKLASLRGVGHRAKGESRRQGP